MTAELPTRGLFRLPELNSGAERGAEHFDLELVEVSELKVTSRQQAFSIVFLGPGDKLMPQHIYRLQHEALGEVDLFLVPVGSKEQGYEYEAVFNQLVH
jgi:hypothetical protein